MVNQILAKQLHNIDGEILEYTTKLMDKLEQVGVLEPVPGVGWLLTAAPRPNSNIPTKKPSPTTQPPRHTSSSLLKRHWTEHSEL